MKLLLLVLIHFISSKAVDTDQYTVTFPNDWIYNEQNSSYHFKISDNLSIGEGIITSISQQEYDNILSYIKVNKNNEIYTKDNYSIYMTNLINLYGVDINEFIVLITNKKTYFHIEAYCESSLYDKMENGLNYIISSFIIKN